MQTFDLEKEKKEILNAYKGLIRACKPHVNKEGRKTIRKAFNLALESHDGMRRKSGEPYIFHPIAVARIVAEDIGLGTTSIVCALLHDVVEDTDVTLQDIEDLFGPSRANIIDGLTKISKAMPGGNSLQAENFRKILLTINDDVRVIIIKIADRLHNMSTLDSMPQHKQLKIASETIYLYAPLAHRLGLYAIKSELEDLSMQYTQADVYQEISKKLKDTEVERKKFITNFIRPLREKLSNSGLEVKITGRPKSVSSIWNKMITKKVQFEEVYDIFAIRVIIDTENKNEKAECWKAYSLITEQYTPNPDRLRDWISVPKANGYEALHTTVMGPKGKWVEVQIRSKRMDLMAEKGIAAHWKYKEGTQDSQLDDWLKKIREILDSPEENTIQFLDNIKLNLFASEIFVFTPKGEMKVLPSGASVLDFAYEIHTDIGNKCIGAKVNHKVVSIRHQVKNGDQVEILTSQTQSPSEEWLDFLITAKGRSIVQHIVNREKRGIARLGKTALESAFKAIKVSFKGKNINKIVEHYHMASDLDLFYALGMNEIDLSELSDFVVDEGEIFIKKKELNDQGIESQIKKHLQENSNFLVFGDNSGEVNFGIAKCCHPLPGDEVVAIDKEGKLQIHQTDCPKAILLMSLYGNKIVKTNWSKSKGITFMTGIIIKGVDSFGVMYKITKVISYDLSLNLRSISIEGEKGEFEGHLTVYVHDKEEVNKLKNKLMELDFINFVEQTDHF